MVGSYMGRVFTVSSQRILTPSNLKGSAGSDWANHEIIGKKARSQWVGPKLKSYTMDILLRAQDGVSPRSTLDYFQRAAEFVRKTKQYEPRVRVMRVEWTQNHARDGGIVPKVVVSFV